MTFRCTSCQATLRFDEQKMAGRRSAKCPRCQANVELPQAGQTSESAPATSPGSQATRTATVSCGACGVRLKVPAAAKASRSRCPRCGSSIELSPAPERAARPEIEESASGATRRIDSRALGMELAAAAMSTPATSAPPMTPGMGPERFAAPVDQPHEPSLTRPAVGPMRDAALGIRSAAQGMEPPAAMPSAARPSAARFSEITAPDPALREMSAALPTQPVPAAQEPPVSRPSFEATAPRPARSEKTRRPARASFPLWRGGVAGALSGGLVGLAFWAGESGIATQGLTWLVSSVPPAAGIEGVPESTMRLALLMAGAILAGIIAAGAGSPGSHANPITVKRCMISALLPGILISLLSVLLGEQPLPEFAVWPAVNWMRDLLAAGLLTPAVNRFLPGSR